MSYDIDLVDPVSGEVLHSSYVHHMRGGTYPVEGSSELSFNITYNYSKIFYKYIDEHKGIRYIYGMTGLASIPILERVIEGLANNVTDNYWDCTEGNAKKALICLLTMAKIRPDGIWEGD